MPPEAVLSKIGHVPIFFHRQPRRGGFGLVWFFGKIGVTLAWKRSEALTLARGRFWIVLGRLGPLTLTWRRSGDHIGAIWPIYIGIRALGGSRSFMDAPGRSPVPPPPRPRSKLAHCHLRMRLTPQIERRSAKKVPKSPIYIGIAAPDGSRRFRDAPRRSPAPPPPRPRSKLAHCRLQT